jgi:hypothetical protein
VRACGLGGRATHPSQVAGQGSAKHDYHPSSPPLRASVLDGVRRQGTNQELEARASELANRFKHISGRHSPTLQSKPDSGFDSTEALQIVIL